MKQNQTVTLPVLEAKKSTFSAWCEKENQLFSCVLESVVTNRQVCLMGLMLPWLFLHWYVPVSCRLFLHCFAWLGLLCHYILLGKEV